VAGEKGEGENRLPFFGRTRGPGRHYSRERTGSAEAPRRRVERPLNYRAELFLLSICRPLLRRCAGPGAMRSTDALWENVGKIEESACSTVAQTTLARTL